MTEKETRNIVILGAGFAGLSVAHYFMKHIYPSLKSSATETYRLVLVDQSTHFWWHISAPRAMVSAKLLPHNKTFAPIMEGFKQYGTDKDIISFHHASPVALDINRRTVTVKDVSMDGSADADAPSHTETIPFYSLIISTGTRTPCAATSFHGSHEKSIAALDDMNKRLSKATSVVIAGGGPIGVETAGEVGQMLNGKVGSLEKRKAKVTLVAGSAKLLPVLSEGLSKKAAKLLGKLGVEVIYNAKVKNVALSSADESGKTTVTLDDGKEIVADVYIPATGIVPNTSFMPKDLLNDKGFVKTNPSTLRVDEAGHRIYCLGDVGSYTRGGVLDLFNAAPALGRNISYDFGIVPGKAGQTGTPKEQMFKSDTSETQFVPVGMIGGVAAFKGVSLPGAAVKAAKGKDYLLRSMPDIHMGNKYKKA